VGDAVGADVGDWNTTRAFGFPIGWAWSAQKPCGTVRVYGKAASSTFAVIVYLWFPAVSSRNRLRSVIDTVFDQVLDKVLHFGSQYSNPYSRLSVRLEFDALGCVVDLCSGLLPLINL
jgi:hypothetical protein